MGVNYFTQTDKREVPCPNCGLKHTCRQEVHLGKSSFGWTFTFAWNDGQYYKSLDEMKEWTKGRHIFDEYGKELTYDEFWSLVASKEKSEHVHDRSVNPSAIEVDGVYFIDGGFS